MLNKAEVRKMAKEAGKRVSPDFLSALEFQVREKVRACVELHNGGKKTLTPEAVHFIFGGTKRG